MARSSMSLEEFLSQSKAEAMRRPGQTIYNYRIANLPAIIEYVNLHKEKLIKIQ